MKSAKRRGIRLKDGPFKGMLILPPLIKGVDSFLHISIPFMKKIFDLESEEYLISDESRISDFIEFGTCDVAPIMRKIEKVYGIRLPESHKGNLLEIFRMVDRNKDAKILMETRGD